MWLKKLVGEKIRALPKKGRQSSEHDVIYIFSACVGDGMTTRLSHRDM